MVIVSFVKPECTYTKGSLSFAGTGLDFSSTGSTVKAAIAALKAATNNNTKVLLAVGGATYNNWGSLNTACIKDLVDDFGFDGEQPHLRSMEQYMVVIFLQYRKAWASAEWTMHQDALPAAADAAVRAAPLPSRV